jgi:glycosyltransferase involved in cell wall biosynthesis
MVIEGGTVVYHQCSDKEAVVNKQKSLSSRIKCIRMQGREGVKVYLEGMGKHIIIQRIESHLRRMGCTIQENNPTGCDVQLSFVHIGRKLMPTVLRLDGIYYDSDTNYNARNSGISAAHQSADSVIYQSNFSRSMCEKYLSPRNPKSHTDVIYNGVMRDWCGTPLPHNGTNIIVQSKWRRHKRLKEIVELFLIHVKKHPETTLHIFGLLHENVQETHPNIKYYGHVERGKFMHHHAQADFTLHLSKKDACPNTVVEAIGANLPVITTNACGGSTEMCKMTVGCIVCDGDVDNIEPCKPYRDSYNILPDKLKTNLLDAMEHLENNKYHVTLPEVLTAEYVAERYFDVFKRLK